MDTYIQVLVIIARLYNVNLFQGVKYKAINNTAPTAQHSLPKRQL